MEHAAPELKKPERRQYNRLTPRFVETVVKPGRHGDGHGLYLHVKPSGSRSWLQRLTINGRKHDLGLGGYPLVSLAEARQAAFENRKLARSGGDPLALRRMAAVPTFEEAAATVIDLHRPTWSNAKHATQWEVTLRDYAFPRLGTLPVPAITTADIMAVLMPIWHDKNETARRLRQRISAVMKWAIAQGFRVDNPAGDALGAALPRRTGNGQRHHPAMPHGEVATAIEAIRGSEAGMASKLALEFLILTAARSGEVRLAAWSEIDMEEAVWTVPAERIKARREHRVPLSTRALEMLEEARALDDGSGLVFAGAKRGKPLSNTTFAKLMRSLKLGAVPHGFRSSFRDWAAEHTSASHEVMEAALAHVVSNKVVAAYARTDLFERRRALMDRWAQYLEGGGGQVVPMVRRGDQA